MALLSFTRHPRDLPNLPKQRCERKQGLRVSKLQFDLENALHATTILALIAFDAHNQFEISEAKIDVVTFQDWVCKVCLVRKQMKKKPECLSLKMLMASCFLATSKIRRANALGYFLRNEDNEINSLNKYFENLCRTTKKVSDCDFFKCSVPTNLFFPLESMYFLTVLLFKMFMSCLVIVVAPSITC